MKIVCPNCGLPVVYPMIKGPYKKQPYDMLGDMIPQFKHGQWWTMYIALVEYEKQLAFDRMAYAGL